MTQTISLEWKMLAIPGVVMLVFFFFYFFIFSCNLGEAITNNKLNLHKSEPAWSSGTNFPHLIVVDVIEDETSV